MPVYFDDKTKAIHCLYVLCNFRNAMLKYTSISCLMLSNYFVTTSVILMSKPRQNISIGCNRRYT